MSDPASVNHSSRGLRVMTKKLRVRVGNRRVRERCHPRHGTGFGLWLWVLGFWVLGIGSWVWGLGFEFLSPVLGGGYRD